MANDTHRRQDCCVLFPFPVAHDLTSLWISSLAFPFPSQLRCEHRQTRPHYAAAGGNLQSTHLAMMKDNRITSLTADFSSSERSFVLITRVSASAVRLRCCLFPLDIVCSPRPLTPALDFRTPLSGLRPRSDLGPLGLFLFDLDTTSPTRTPTNLMVFTYS
ncbi:uncharacterized protein [Nerophis lumbriciformis]|uniref:uncharacterized protein isoform X2 n=1 Tax=Nerophis lumbriciformis TaxID=546530 RepID=UPI002ADF1A5E|nr:uncharacterized protein LOC133616238 isoform X2 [Nerophis lumbriciformis]